jgi:ABC-type multidrug transport system ATPase subunit
MPEIRKSLGICPQHNVLYNHLSVYEHLTMYATLKGVRSELVHQAAVDKINEVGLEAKRDVFAGALSGGMKRKLSVAIALVGGSRIVFLDEPTSGMDPYSRRATWELLRKNKAGRVIVLTTHFMDEADLLGDRIAIMANGGLKCCGSSLFLKARFGIGYNLTMVKASAACRVDDVSDMVLRHVPAARVLSTAAGEMAYQLPLAAVKQFADMFVELENEREHLGIGGYGISMTTLEEVFMRILAVADDESSPSNGNGHSNGLASSPSKDREIGNIVGGDDDNHAVNGNGHSTPKNEMKRRVLQKTRSLSSNGDVRLQPNDGIERIQREPSSSTRQLTELLRKRYFIVVPPSFPSILHTLIWLFVCPLSHSYLCALRDLKGRFFEVLLPVIVVALVLLILRLNISPAGPSVEMSADLYAFKTLSVQAKGVGDGEVAPLPVSPYFGINEPITINFLNQRDVLSVDTMNGTQNSIDASYYLLQTTLNHTGNRYASLLTNDTIHLILHANISSNETKYFPLNIPTRMTILHNSTFYHALPIMSAEVTQARLRANTWKRAHANAE